MAERVPVALRAIGLLCPAGIAADGVTGGAPGAVPGFRPRDFVANRKNIKLMGRSVQLGVAGISLALSQVPELEQVPPVRRAMFVGSNPLASDSSDLVPALEAATDTQGDIDLQRFAQKGIPLINPLWLVRGLSNNILGFASAQHDFQGDNANYCQGSASGRLALAEAMESVAEGRADLAVAGAADSLLGAEALFPGRALGEGAAFFVLTPCSDRAPWALIKSPGAQAELSAENVLGFMGVADELVALARAVLQGRLPVNLGSGGQAISVS